MPQPSVPALIVGAGQAGLSVAYHLAHRGLEPGRDFRVVDRGPVTGGAWQHRWQSLRLDRTHRVSDLPGMRELGLTFADADQSLPARDVVEDYYRQFEDDYHLQVERPVAVTKVEDAHGLLDVTTSAGRLTTRVLVNASGTWGRPFVPWYPGVDTFGGRQLHTVDYRSAEDFTGQRVLVVGGGTSAIGFVLELEDAASEVVWTTRRPVVFTEDASLGMEGGIRAVAQQDEAAREGLPLPSIVSGTGVPTTPAMRAAIDRGILVARPIFDRIEPHGARWRDGSFSAVDVILWATGFRAELDHLAPLGLREPGGGIRVVDGRSVRDPRIFLAGYGPQASTIGANRAGRRTALSVIAELTRDQPVTTA